MYSVNMLGGIHAPTTINIKEAKAVFEEVFKFTY